MDPSAILQLYQLGKKQLSIHPFGSGLINNTWKVDSTESRGSYILQRINSSVFNNPQAIDHNIMSIAKYLQRHFPEYLFMAPLQTPEGASLIFDKDSGYFRLFQFLEGSRSFEVLDNPSQAFEAARQFARFTRLLSGLDASALQTTIPDFHNLLLRYQQFLFALETGNRERSIIFPTSLIK